MLIILLLLAFALACIAVFATGKLPKECGLLLAALGVLVIFLAIVLGALLLVTIRITPV